MKRERLQILYVLDALALSGLLLARNMPRQTEEAAVVVVLIQALLLVGAWLWSFTQRPEPRKGWFLPNEARPLLLFAFSMSAHTLNLAIPVFATYEPVFQGIMVIVHLALLLYPVRHWLPGWGKGLLHFGMGLGTVVWLYMAIFILPVAIISIPLLVVLGISAHAFVPALMLIWFVRRSLREPSAAYWAGVILPFLALAGIEIQWYRIQRTVKAVHARYAENQANTQPVPEWVALAEKIPDGILTRKVVLAETHSQMTSFATPDNLLGNGGRIKIHHDPLVVIACWIFGQTGISEETAVHLLEARYDNRHDTHRRLWSDKGIYTDSVQTRVEIWPGHRLAYLEKTITVAMEPRQRDFWGPTEGEAVFSFYLPDGAAATSLSLWVNGVEQPSRLTTRGKADSAYVEIVGRQRRDPALLHWQEGNRVTITVFPVSETLPRRLKVGFTLPLALEDGNLVLHNLPFQGPDHANARETAFIHFANGRLPQGLRSPWRFREDSKEGLVTLNGPYRPDWELHFTAPPLQTGTFCFDGDCVQAGPLKPTYQAFVPQQIVLDVNAAWVPGEMGEIWRLARQTGATVSACVDGVFVPLMESDYEATLAQLHGYQYQILPLFSLPDPAHTLIVTKGRALTPMLSDFEGAPLETNMRAYLAGQGASVRVYSLSQQPPAWLGALHQLRAVSLATGDAQRLGNLLQHNIFPVLPEHENQIALPNSGMVLTRTTGQTAADSRTPDHVMRLFAYSDLLRDIGRQYYDRAALEATWRRKAERAYVVSPVSSLIVLESIADYEQTGIGENTNTLGNVSKPIASGNAGAAPEPHEWALIVLVALTLGWFGWKGRR